MSKPGRRSSPGVPAGAGRKDAGPRKLKKAPRTLILLVCLLLTAITLIPFSRLLKCDFVNYDDPIYVTQNPHVQEFTARSFLWAFNVGFNSNWHPLTWMSHMLDYRLWGANAVGHHATSLLLHLVGVILLFMILNRMTQSLWRSAFVAALFAVHPLHVESVAWIAERKDVLSTVFWMLTIGAYVLYVERPGAGRYWAVVLLYALGLTAKPMLVSLPLVLLMLDYWPLGRLRSLGLRRLVTEKAPLLVLAATSSIITVIAQQRGQATSSLNALSVGMRISNALVNYADYVIKMVWPRKLAVFYPHPIDTMPSWKIVVSALALILVTLLAIKQRRHRPYLLVGWCWYIVTLIPVIGLVQVGAQAMADRYTYVPLIGPFIMLVWAVPESEKPVRAVPAVSVVIAILMACTWVQVGYWRNSIILFQHTLVVAPTDNYTAHADLGRAYADEGRYQEAISEYEKALALRQTEAHIFCEYGDCLAKTGRVQEAVEQYQTALRVDPKLSQAQDRLTAIRQSRSEAALARRLLQRKGDQNSAPAHANRATILESQGKTREAIREYREAIRLDPKFAAAHNNLAVLYDNHGRAEEAIREFEEAIRIKLDFPEAHNNYAVTLYLHKDYAEALREIELCRKYGGTPNPKLVQALSEKLPGSNP